MTLDKVIVLHFLGKAYAQLSDLGQMKHGYLEF